MSIFNRVGKFFRELFGFEPTPTQIRIIRALRNNPDIRDGDITVTPRGGIKRSVESIRRSKSYRDAVRRAHKRTIESQRKDNE